MESSASHLSVLVEAGRILGTSLDYAVTLQQLADLVVPALADWCTVDVADDAGTLRRLAVAHRDPDRAGELRQLGQQFPIAAATDHPVAQALRTGEVVYLPAVAPEDLTRGAPDPRRRARLAALGIGSAIAVPLIARGQVLGVLSVVRIDPSPGYAPADVALARELGQRAAIAIDRARLYAAEQEARARAEAARQRFAFLADVSVRLAASLDAHATLASITHLAVPALADWCIVDLVGGPAEPDRVMAAHADPAMEGLIAELRRRYPPDPARPTGIGHAMRTGRSEFHAVVADATLAAAAQDAEHLAILRKLGLRSVVFVPLVAGGAALGGLTLATGPSGRTYTTDDLLLAEEVARRAALALHNARLYAATQKEAERVARLQHITAGLAAALTAEEVAGVIVNHAVPALGAKTGVVARLGRDDATLEIVQAVGYPPELLDRVRRIPLAAASPVTEAARERAPVWIESPDELVGRFPRALDYPTLAFSQAWAALPLLAGGKVLGALTLSFAAPHAFAPDERAYVATLAQQCAQALERAQLYEAERDARTTAQAAIAARDEFLSVAAHELKTPVAAVRLVIQATLHRIARSGPLDSAAAERLVRDLDRQSDRLTRLVNQLLDVTRLETRRMRLDRAPTDLGTLIRQVVDAVEPDEARARIRVPDGAPLVVDADALRLEQVFGNLLDNALKHGGVGAIEVTAARADGAAVIAIADQGPGVLAARRARLFERFVQLDEHSSPSGLGLGLYISRLIVELHGGTLTAEFPDSGGSTFVVRLPG